MSRSIRSALRARSMVSASVAMRLPPERHRDRPEGRARGTGDLEGPADEGELVLPLGRDLLHPHDLHDLRARGGEHVAVHWEETFVHRGEHLEADGVARDAHRAGLL